VSLARRVLVLGGCVAVLVLALLIAPSVSASDLSGAAAERALRDLHRPRAIFGAFAGFGLALCGVVLQSVLKNPLASPYTLGIASGAAVGAVTAIRFAGGSAMAVSAGALLGAVLTAGLVYVVAALRHHAAETLLLTGVAVTLFAGAITTLLHYLALSSTPDLVAMIRWSMASLEVVGTDQLWPAGILVGLGILVLLPIARQLDVASLDDESARGLGVDPVRVRRLAFVGTSVITAGVVAFAGPVGFVGLIVPHAVRPFTGPDPRLLLPCAACVGGAFLIAADLAARTLLYPTSLPLNVITYAIGCPAFIWILVRRPSAGPIE
jgi:iron complex transport system permease protein